MKGFERITENYTPLLMPERKGRTSHTFNILRLVAAFVLLNATVLGGLYLIIASLAPFVSSATQGGVLALVIICVIFTFAVGKLINKYMNVAVKFIVISALIIPTIISIIFAIHLLFYYTVTKKEFVEQDKQHEEKKSQLAVRALEDWDKMTIDATTIESTKVDPHYNGSASLYVNVKTRLKLTGKVMANSVQKYFKVTYDDVNDRGYRKNCSVYSSGSLVLYNDDKLKNPIRDQINTELVPDKTYYLGGKFQLNRKEDCLDRLFLNDIAPRVISIIKTPKK